LKRIDVQLKSLSGQWLMGACAAVAIAIGGCAADRFGAQWSVSDSAAPRRPREAAPTFRPSNSQIRLVGFEQKPTEPRTADLFVAGNQAWGDTGIDVVAGQPMTLHAEGTVSVGRSAKGTYDDPTQVGPEGTFLYGDNILKKDFPLASAGSGPAPCFCLIGRIGNSEPFFVGRGRSWKPAESGRLYLGTSRKRPKYSRSPTRTSYRST
jgi:hypothetical protein